jgi:hypothetical protein
VLVGTGLLTRDGLRWSAPSHPDGQWLIADLSVAYSCGAVADSHRASRSSRQRIVSLTFFLLLELNPPLGTDALLKRMFDLPHFSH